jgi:SAM-dependent methyltransferase
VSDTIENPRQPLADAVRYAVDQAGLIRRMLASRGLALGGLRYLELGPGTDLAAQLVLAGLGAKVTVADKFLVPWDQSYHPEFYRAFLAAYPEPCPAIEAALTAGSHDAVVRCVRQPAEDLTGVADRSVDFVLSNAVLEHVLDIEAAAAELHRISHPDGVQAHQIDLRDHRDFTDPLGLLLMTNADYESHRRGTNGRHGMRFRMPELLDLFVRHFWIDEVEINGRADPDYVREIVRRLPLDSPYTGWPVASLVNLSGRLWLRPRQAKSAVRGATEKLVNLLRRRSG